MEPKQNFFTRLFWDKKFFHYTWVSIVVSIGGIFLLWVLIDVLGTPTIVAGTVATAATFIGRYLLFTLFKIVG